MLFKNFFVIMLVLSTSSCLASDVFVMADGEKGQGIFRQQNGSCYVVTAGHVVAESAANDDLYIITHNKDKIPFRVVQQYKDDVALLELEDYYPPCIRRTYWSEGQRLNEMIRYRKDAEIRFSGKNGSSKIIRVRVKSMNSVSTLTVEPLIASEEIRPGFSGSPVYIGDVPIGLLTSVEEDESDIGIVIRQDYLHNLLSTFFDNKLGKEEKDQQKPDYVKPNSGFHKVVKVQEEEPTVFTGSIKAGEILQAVISAEKNSPLLLGFTQEKCKYEVKIYSAGKKKLWEKKADWTGVAPFTPPKSGNYTVELKGIKGEGEYSFSQKTFTSDAVLNNVSNVLDRNDFVFGKIAKDAVGTYRFPAEKNSPVLLTFGAKDCHYGFVVSDAGGTVVLRPDSYGRLRTYPFTPPRTGSYTIKLTGIRGAGEYTIGFDEFTTNTELYSPRNVLDTTDSGTGRIAQGATGIYHFSAEKNSPVLLTFGAKDCHYGFAVYDAGGAVVLRPDSYGRLRTYPFTPPRTGSYTIKLMGTKGAGEYTIGLDGFTSNVELNSPENILQKNDVVSGRMAIGATGKYQFHTEKGVPVTLTFGAKDCHYGFVVSDASGAVVLRPDSYGHLRSYSFTPPRTGSYIIKLTGTKGAGEYTIGLADSLKK